MMLITATSDGNSLKEPLDQRTRGIFHFYLISQRIFGNETDFKCSYYLYML